MMLAACTGKQSEGVRATVHDNTPYTDAQDTIDATQAVDDFMQLVMAGRVDDAIEKLYIPGVDTYAMPDPLALDDKEKYKTTLSLFPIDSYEITDMKFRNTMDNEINVRMSIANPDGTPSGQHIDLLLCPCLYMAKWYLLLKDNAK